MQCDENGTVQRAEQLNQSCTEIIVVRHGETHWNALGKMQVAERLSMEPNISAVYSSDLKRAPETAEIIASRFDGVEVIKDQGLREKHTGAFEGLVYHELAKINPEGCEALTSVRLDQEIPGGGETHGQLHERCFSSLRRIGDKHRGKRVIVVTHGGVIQTLHELALPEDKPGDIAKASISIIQLSEGDKWSFKSWNDITHLKNAGHLKAAFGGDGSSS